MPKKDNRPRMSPLDELEQDSLDRLHAAEQLGNYAWLRQRSLDELIALMEGALPRRTADGWIVPTTSRTEPRAAGRPRRSQRR
jgi:hypothetical protein